MAKYYSFRSDFLANQNNTSLITDPNNELFILLKNKFITFLDQRCNEICGNYLK